MSTKFYFDNREDAVSFVRELRAIDDSQSIMTMRWNALRACVNPSGGFYVEIATSTSEGLETIHR